MSSSQGKSEVGFDPDAYRMTLGEHLEELRKRIVLGLVGLILATFVCLYFGERMLVFFCQPLMEGLKAAGVSTQTYNTQMTATFMLYLKVSLIVAACVSGPWLLYQVWQFVAAGLYPNERKTVTRYIPLSIGLFISGVALAYWVVMPITVKFLLAFNASFSLAGVEAGATTQPLRPEQVVTVPHLQGDPGAAELVEGQLWFNEPQGRLKMRLGSETRVIPFGPDSMVASMITIDDYVNLTIMTLLVFGLAFQLPLGVLAANKVGIVDVELLRRSRRIVYFSLSVVAAVIAPGDVVSAMMALWVPLLVLYEFGIWLCVWTGGKGQG